MVRERKREKILEEVRGYILKVCGKEGDIEEDRRRRRRKAKRGGKERENG